MSTSTTPTLARETKTHWQEVTLEDAVRDGDAEDFMRIIADLPTGTEFTVNEIRDQLDAASIPPRARGGLFYGAGKAGLIAPVTVTVSGREVPVFVPSTGQSANAAMVRVYRRLP